jgi:predicted phosphoribosyltransferase
MIEMTEGFVLGIPAGGVPVAKEVTKVLGLPLDVAIVSKITLPWNTEAGYGAVAFDGTIRLNRDLVEISGLNEEQIHKGILKTKEKVSHRKRRFESRIAQSEIREKPAIVVDDGLASGFTMQVAVEALTKSGFKSIIVAVPTGHDRAVRDISRRVSAVYCANIRTEHRYAVAEAYQSWSDVTDNEVGTILKSYR